MNTIASGSRTVAIVQRPPALLDLAEGLNRAVEAIDEAQSADLVVFPETWLTGYPAWVFGMAGWGDPEGKRWYGELIRQSPVLGGVDDADDGLAPIRAAARRNKVTVVLGLNERSQTGGTLYNSLATIDAEGRLVNLHRKTVPTHTERIVWGHGDGAGLRAVTTPAGRVGGLICWEHWMPLARQALHAEGEQIHVAAWPDTPEIHEIAARSYAREGGCFVVSAALFQTTADIPPSILDAYRVGVGPDAPAEGVLFDGGSSIAAPDGSWLVEPVRGRAELIVAEINLDAVDEAHTDLDVVGHYSRPDIFTLQVDMTRPKNIEQRSELP
jgi:predicted amidohydrolase